MIKLDNYTIIEKIGYGSYSTVYKAQEKMDSKEYVAIKVVEKARLSARGQDDIVREIKVMKMLKHKHVVLMKEFQWDDKNIYIIMEYCDGGDLSHFIKKRVKLSEKTCQKFLQQLAVALQFLRSRNISHLDLKPHNLLLVTKPKITLKVGDFGFAQFLSESTQKNSIRGSPLYMAPEMFLGGKYDVRADLWSVGVITYECLFGKAPYSSGSQQELYHQLHAKIPIAIPTVANLSEECRDFVSRLLVHDPEKRMNYDEFFAHPFLDLEHVPSIESYNKAMQIISVAIHLDRKGNHIESFNRYCEGLRYLLPILNDEVNDEKKMVLRSKVIQYTKRAEELKCMLSLNSNCSRGNRLLQKSHSTTSKEETSQKEGKSNSDTDEPDSSNSNSVPVYKSSLKYLVTLCSKSPDLASALEIGTTAQMYLAEGQYKLAFQKFEQSLGILIPRITLEPDGIRKNLLFKQTHEWMQQAESAKSLLKLQENDEDPSPSWEIKEKCTIQ